MGKDKITATVTVTRSGYLDIDGHYYEPEKLVKDGLVDLYGVRDFRFRVKPYCWRVTQEQVKTAIRALRALGYTVV